jgi:hypothetical protein
MTVRGIDFGFATFTFRMFLKDQISNNERARKNRYFIDF